MDGRDASKLVKSERFKNYSLGIASIITAFLIPFIGYYYTDSQKSREIENRYIELGIKILSEKPDSSNENLRVWAVELVNKFSEVKLKDSVKNNLIKDIPLILKGSDVNENINFVYPVKNGSDLLGYLLMPDNLNLFTLYFQNNNSINSSSTEIIEDLIDKKSFLENLGKYIVEANNSNKKLIISADDGSYKWMGSNMIKFGKDYNHLRPLKIVKFFHPPTEQYYLVQGWLNY